MNYIRMILPAFPFAALITTVIYAFIYWLTKHKRNKPAFLQRIFEFTLVGWFVMFIYVTQVMSFGNGLGESLNLIPLKPVYLAIKYGAVNAGMATQIVLNILMCIPLGILLPLISKKRFGGFLPVLGFSFIITFLTEASQLLSGRSADIDDIIANSFGGVLGFALVVFFCGIVYWIKSKRQGKPICMPNYPLKLAASIMLVLLLVSPLVVIRILEGNKGIGYVYYGHLQPTHIEYPETISADETSANLYKNILLESQDSLTTRLIEITGFDCAFEDVGYGTFRCGKAGDKKVIFIYPYNTWSVTYTYAEPIETDPSKLPGEPQALEIAKTYLENFGIPLNSVEYAGLREDFGDNNLHLMFMDRTSTRNHFIWGSVDVTIGEEGTLLGISDDRTYFEFVKTVKAISPQKAISIAQDIGVGEWSNTASITKIEPSFYFNEDTGYLIPTWQIHGTLTGYQGQEYEWTPNIDATK